MGLLDDAIREHLELKRQHGGDASEIERQEREAFGPAGRRAAPTEGEAAAAPDAADADVAAGDEVAPGAVAADEVAPGEVAAAPLADDEVVEPAPEDAVVPAPPSADPPATAEQPAAEEAPTTVQPVADEIPPPIPDEAPRRGRETGAPGYDEDPWLEVDDEPPPEAAEEDVLEETPDFLQETPEHDRLWFEQKPPRDFDWDK
jgi:hypothetical protein